MSTSSCVNKVVLVGNLGADPETRFTPRGTPVATVRLATDQTWTDRRGQARRRTEWHRLVLWRRLAEIAHQYLKKGARVYIEGRLQTRSWDDADGRRRDLTEVVVTELQLLDGQGGPGELDLLYGREPGHRPHEAGPLAGASLAGAVDDTDDGLPF